MRGQVASYLPCVALGLGRDSGKRAGREQARIGTVAKPSIPAAWLVRLAQDRCARELGAPWAGRVPACLLLSQRPAQHPVALGSYWQSVHLMRNGSVAPGHLELVE